MEVVHPDTRVVPFGRCQRRLREAAVHVDVALPRLLGDAESIDEVVEQRPERVVADAAVEVLDLVLVEKHGMQPVSLERAPNGAGAALWHRSPWPADPGTVTLGRAEGRHEPTGGRLERRTRAFGDQAHGQTVGDDNHVARSPAYTVVLHPAHPPLSDVCGGL